MAKCSRHDAQRRRMRGHQSSYDMKMVLNPAIPVPIPSEDYCEVNSEQIVF